MVSDCTNRVAHSGFDSNVSDLSSQSFAQVWSLWCPIALTDWIILVLIPQFQIALASQSEVWILRL